MPARTLIAAIALVACLRVASPARAAGADGAPLVVELAVTDSLPADQLAVLRGVLESQLSAHGLSLRSEPDVGDVRGWLARDSGDALLRVALDASASSGWRLLLVDASRGRAVARTLTGGVRRDRAAIEAVVDIVVSAALALHEGLEVASQTVDEALTEGAPVAAPAATSARAAPVVTAASPDAAFSTSALRLRVGAGPAVATFARAAPASWGGAVSVSAWRGAAGLELSAARFLSQTVGGTIGSFAIDRTSFGMSGAVATGGPRARLEGGLGLMFEILRRGDATAAGGSIATNAPDTVTRLGPQATATLDVSVSRRVTLTWSLGVSYFPRRVRYLSTAGPDATLAEPWPFTGASTLRVNVVVP